MESSSEGLLIHELTRLSTDAGSNNKRSSSPLLYEDSKKPRLSDDDMETSSRESRWSRYRDCTNLSTLTERSDDDEANNPDQVLEGYNVHVAPHHRRTAPLHQHIAAHEVPDLEEHIDKLAMELEEWSLVNLKEWRQKKACEDLSLMDIDDIPPGPSPTKRASAIKAARQRQKEAKRKLMRALRHHETGEESMQEER